LHVGHARSFVLAWLSIRARGGRVLLRVEDLDADRVKPGSREACVTDLEWLGLDWDGAVALQSERTGPMQAAVERLLAAGAAYACVCTRREIESSLSAPHSGGELRYAGTCRGEYASVADAEQRAGRAAGVRLAVAPGAVAVEDALHGRIAFEPHAEVGDFLLRRRDGAFAYQLAVVVDDAEQGVTEVLRGDDLLPSSARQALLQDALGLPRPTWVHVPLVVDDAGRRLAKRAGDLALAELRAAGVDPRALLAWIARSAGLDAGERATVAELVPCFDLAALPRGSVRFGARELERLRASRA
jgi:glutamyl-tRNA synthetase